MSLKTCCRVVPLVKNLINSQHTCLFRSVPFQISNTCRTSFLLCNKISPRVYSTEAKSDIKQVYYGVLTPQIKAVKMFSISSSLVGIIAQPFLYKEIALTGNIPMIVAAYSFIGFFTIVTPILLHFITKKYITHLEYRESTDTYIARTVNFFCMTKETEFSSNDVIVPDVPGMFTTFIAKGKSMFLDPRYFDNPDHYRRIMGFDKPIDFKLYQNTENQVKKDT